MSDHDLLARIESQAADIATLKLRVADYAAKVSGECDRQQEALRNQLRSMADGGVNCGSNYGCALARRRLGDGG